VLFVGGLLNHWIGQYWRIGVDLQGEARCLPWLVWAVKVGAPATLARDSYVAVIPAGEFGMGVDAFIRNNPTPSFIIKQVAGLPGDAIVVIDNEARMGGQEYGALTLTTMGKVPVAPGGYDRVVIDNEARMGGQEYGALTLTTMGKVPVAPGGYDRVEIVPPGRVALAGTLPHAYDSRYWGTAGQNEVVGVAYPIF